MSVQRSLQTAARSNGLGMLDVFDLRGRSHGTTPTFLLVGPTGTGKELVARAIHQISPVSQQQLAVCNCSAMVDTLLESQLFGHVRGAFTGATDTRRELFEYANGGTVFLDEVGRNFAADAGETSEGDPEPRDPRVGSPEVRHIDVRLIAATKPEFARGGARGTFSAKIFFLPAEFRSRSAFLR